MTSYLPIFIVDGDIQFKAVVLDELTTDGYQVYCSGGWLRCSKDWITSHSVVIGDSRVCGLVRELRGRGAELEKQDFLEVTHGS